ncbi:hypothetical protein ACWEOE_31745 [Amycolatopsis sp. NPDC004368]
MTTHRTVAEATALLAQMFRAMAADIDSIPLPMLNQAVEILPAGSPEFDRALAELLGRGGLTPTHNDVVSGD